MKPLFTIDYAEYACIQELQKYFRKKDGYSMWIPASRQEKGIDLLLLRNRKRIVSVARMQVKSSRSYPFRSAQNFEYDSWFNTFTPDANADFFLLEMCIPDGNPPKRLSGWKSLVMIFTQSEMVEFLNNVKTVKGQPDKMFGFGARIQGEHVSVCQSRGDRHRKYEDYSQFLLDRRMPLIQSHLS